MFHLKISEALFCPKNFISSLTLRSFYSRLIKISRKNPSKTSFIQFHFSIIYLRRESESGKSFRLRLRAAGNSIHIFNSWELRPKFLRMKFLILILLDVLYTSQQLFVQKVIKSWKFSLLVIRCSDLFQSLWFAVFWAVCYTKLKNISQKLLFVFQTQWSLKSNHDVHWTKKSFHNPLVQLLRVIKVVRFQFFINKLFLFVINSAPGERTSDAGFNEPRQDGSKLYRTTDCYIKFIAITSDVENIARKLCSITDYTRFWKSIYLIDKLWHIFSQDIRNCWEIFICKKCYYWNEKRKVRY